MTLAQATSVCRFLASQHGRSTGNRQWPASTTRRAAAPTSETDGGLASQLPRARASAIICLSGTSQTDAVTRARAPGRLWEGASCLHPLPLIQHARRAVSDGTPHYRQAHATLGVSRPSEASCMSSMTPPRCATRSRSPRRARDPACAIDTSQDDVRSTSGLCAKALGKDTGPRVQVRLRR